MSRLFPLTLTSERRVERYKRLLKRCLRHGIDLTSQIDIFYHSMNYTSKGIIDATCCGAFKRKSAKEARQLIEDLVTSNYRDPSETLASSNRLKGSRVIDLNRMTAIEAKLDALMNKLGNQDRRMDSAHEVGTMEGNEQKYSDDEGLAHEVPYQFEEAQFVNGNIIYNFKPNLNLTTHYKPALRNNENFSYGGRAQQGLRPVQNFQQQ